MGARAEGAPAAEHDDAIRVLWLINQLGKGGAERLLLSALACHDRTRYDFEAAYLLAGNDIVVPDFEAADVPVHCLGVSTSADPRWVLRLRRLLRTARFDIVHVHSPLAASALRLLVATMPPDRRPRVVVTEHASWHSYHMLTRALNEISLPFEDAHIAVSEDARAAMPRRLRRRTQVVVHGVLIDELSALRQERTAVRDELGVGDGEIVVMSVANLVPEKNYRDLLLAARQVVARWPTVRFFAAGHGPLADELAMLRDELGLADRFIFLGYRRDAVRLLAGADVFTLSSKFEGYPVAVMEALTMGLPVVATAVGGVPDAVRDGVEGRVVPAHQPEVLAGALLEVVEDPDKRAAMARAALERSRLYDMKRSVAALEDTYAAVLDLPPRRMRSRR